MSTPITVECDLHFATRSRGRKELQLGPEPPRPTLEPGRVPRVARLMALAIRYEQLIREGAIGDYAEIARLGHVTPARVSQIMSLLLLAPDVQEEILFLPRLHRGRGQIHMRQLRPIAMLSDWREQRRRWRELCQRVGI